MSWIPQHNETKLIKNYPVNSKKNNWFGYNLWALDIYQLILVSDIMFQYYLKKVTMCSKSMCFNHEFTNRKCT